MVLKDTRKLPQTTTNEQRIRRCEFCDYESSDRSNWAKHIKTSKHKKLAMVQKGTLVVPQTTTKYTCTCGKSYNHPSGLYRHKRSCTYEPSEPGVKTQNEVVAQDKDQVILDLLKQNAEQQKVIIDLVQRAGNNNTISTNSHNTNVVVQLNSNYPNALPIQRIVDSIMALPYCVTHDPKSLTDALSNILTLQTDEERTIRSVKNTLYVKEDTGFKEDKNVEVFDTIKKNTERDQVGKAATQNPNMFHREKEGKEYPELVSGVMKELTPREKKKMKNGIIGAIGNDDMS